MNSRFHQLLIDNLDQCIALAEPACRDNNWEIRQRLRMVRDVLAEHLEAVEQREAAMQVATFGAVNQYPVG